MAGGDVAAAAAFELVALGGCFAGCDGASRLVRPVHWMCRSRPQPQQRCEGAGGVGYLALVHVASLAHGVFEFFLGASES